MHLILKGDSNSKHLSFTPLLLGTQEYPYLKSNHLYKKVHTGRQLTPRVHVFLKKLGLHPDKTH